MAPQMIKGWIWVNAPKQMLNSRSFTGWTPNDLYYFPLILDNHPIHFSWRGVSCFPVTTSHLSVNFWTICWLRAGIFVEFFFIPWKTMKVEEWRFSGIGWVRKLLELHCKNPVTKMCVAPCFPTAINATWWFSLQFWRKLLFSFNLGP